MMGRFSVLVLVTAGLAGCQSAERQRTLSDADLACEAQAGAPGSPAHDQCLAALRQKRADEMRDFRALTDRLRR